MLQEKFKSAQTIMDQGRHLDYFNEMYQQIADARNADDIAILAIRLSLLGRNLVWSGRVKEGYQLQSEADFLIKEAEVPLDVRQEIIFNWAEIYIATGRYRTALEYLDKNASVNLPGEKMIYHRLSSMAYNELNEGRKAKFHSREHFNIAQSTGSPLDTARALRNEAIADIIMQPDTQLSWEKISSNLATAREIAQKSENVDVVSAIAYAEVLLEQRRGNYELALTIALEGYEQTVDVGYVHRTVLLSSLISQTYHLLGQNALGQHWAARTENLAECDGPPYQFGKYLDQALTMQKFPSIDAFPN